MQEAAILRDNSASEALRAESSDNNRISVAIVLYILHTHHIYIYIYMKRNSHTQAAGSFDLEAEAKRHFKRRAILARSKR